MNDNLNIFEQALQKLAFRQPVPFEARQFALYNKRKALELTLKKFGDYSIFYGLTIRIYFYAKRLGISLSVLQSKIILIAVTAIVCGALYSAVLLTSGILQNNATVENITSINLPDEVEKPIEEESDDIKHAKYVEEVQKKPSESYPAKKEKKRKTQTNAVKYRIGIKKFSGDIDEPILTKITDDLAVKLSGLKGADRVLNLRKRKDDKNVSMLFSGSVVKFGSKYIINTRIVDVETSKVVFIFSGEIKDIDQINNTITEISQQADSKIE